MDAIREDCIRRGLLLPVHARARGDEKATVTEAELRAGLKADPLYGMSVDEWRTVWEFIQVASGEPDTKKCAVSFPDGLDADLVTELVPMLVASRELGHGHILTGADHGNPWWRVVMNLTASLRPTAHFAPVVLADRANEHALGRYNGAIWYTAPKTTVFIRPVDARFRVRHFYAKQRATYHAVTLRTDKCFVTLASANADRLGQFAARPNVVSVFARRTKFGQPNGHDGTLEYVIDGPSIDIGAAARRESDKLTYQLQRRIDPERKGGGLDTDSMQLALAIQTMAIGPGSRKLERKVRRRRQQAAATEQASEHAPISGCRPSRRRPGWTK